VFLDSLRLSYGKRPLEFLLSLLASIKSIPGCASVRLASFHRHVDEQNYDQNINQMASFAPVLRKLRLWLVELKMHRLPSRIANKHEGDHDRISHYGYPTSALCVCHPHAHERALPMGLAAQACSHLNGEEMGTDGLYLKPC